jgi:hypothetical protein
MFYQNIKENYKMSKDKNNKKFSRNDRRQKRMNKENGYSPEFLFQKLKKKKQ